MRTVALFQHALEQWETSSLKSREQVYAFAKDLKPHCDSGTNLFVIDLQPDDPLEFRLDSLVENVDMRGMRTTLGCYPDQEYVKRDVAPFFVNLKETGEVSRLRMKSRIQDQFAVYDRLLLPMSEHSKVRWGLSLTKTRFLMPANQSVHILTSRQEDILFLLSQGLSSKEAAQRLGISHRTVEHQISSIKEKLGARNVTHAVAIAVARSILE